MEILSFEHAAATRLGKRVDHLIEILKLEHAAATADAPKKPKKVDHVVEILKLEHAAAVRAARPKAKGRTGARKKVDHIMEILKLEHQAVQNKELEFRARVQALLAARHQSIQGSNGLLSWQEV